MALTPENIAKINEFLADCAILRSDNLAEKYFPGRCKSYTARAALVSSFRVSLRLLGVDAQRAPQGADTPELAEFRAWKARQNQDQNTPVA